jgi:hypothetical protein
MGGTNLNELLEIVPKRFGNNVKVSGSPCLGLCSINWEYSKAPYVKVNNEVVSEESDYSFIITSDRNIVANFTLIDYDITATVSPENSGSVTGIGNYYHGDEVTLTAVPNTGYSFVNWTVEGKEVSTQNPYTTTITEDIEIKANFAELEQRYTIRLNNNWRQSTTISNPNPSQYDGVYESYSNYKVNNGIATIQTGMPQGTIIIIKIGAKSIKTVIQ